MKSLSRFALSTFILAGCVVLISPNAHARSRSYKREEQQHKREERYHKREGRHHKKYKDRSRYDGLSLSLGNGDFTFSIGTGPRYVYRPYPRYYRPVSERLRPVVGTCVSRLPIGYRTVIINNRYYYLYDGVYYDRTVNGYTVVEPFVQPVVSVVPVVQKVTPYDDFEVTLSVPNQKGGYTQVTIARQGDGYVGPQGEYYESFPSVEYLRAIYGGA